MRQDHVTSEKPETSVTENPENKGIRVERYSHKYSSVAKIHHYHWNHKYSFVAKIQHYLRCTSCMVTKSMISKGVMFYFVYSSFA